MADPKSLQAFGQQAMSSIDPNMLRTLQAKLATEYKVGDIGILAPVSAAGLFILAVAPSSPASVAGLKPGEFIESVNWDQLDWAASECRYDDPREFADNRAPVKIS